MLLVGKYNTLKVLRKVDFGFYLGDEEGNDVLLPTRFVPEGLEVDAELEVFIYHDSESRLIATTQKPFAAVGDIAFLKAVDVTPQGAFLQWGLMKDVFVPLSMQVTPMYPGQSYLVYLFIDEQTGRVTATEKFRSYLSNEDLTVKVGDTVDLIVWQKTDLGYNVIVNNKHIGLIHSNELFRDLEYGQHLKGFIKTIREDNKIDVSAGTKGYERVLNETDKIMALLHQHDGYLPYYDKSQPDEIYNFFGMSKKAFKMAIGKLYKEKKIELTSGGIKLI